jgi:uncharacterized LabA/DUF88 family protein
MPHSQADKIALFIDGANLYATAKALGFEIDYRRLLKEFQDRGTVLRAFYYSAVVDGQEPTSIHPLIDWLDYNGYTVVTKTAKKFTDASGRRQLKSSMSVELAVAAANRNGGSIAGRARFSCGPCDMVALAAARANHYCGLVKSPV